MSNTRGVFFSLTGSLNATDTLSDTSLWCGHDARVRLALVQSLVRHAVAAHYDAALQLHVAVRLDRRTCEHAHIAVLDHYRGEHHPVQCVELGDPIRKDENYSPHLEESQYTFGDEPVAMVIRGQFVDHDADQGPVSENVAAAGGIEGHADPHRLRVAFTRNPSGPSDQCSRGVNPSGRSFVAVSPITYRARKHRVAMFITGAAM